MIAYVIKGLGGSIICGLWLSSFPYNASNMASSYILVAFTVEVYLAIVHPVRHRLIFSYRIITISVSIIWIASITYPAVVFMVLSRVVDGLCYVAYEWSKYGKLISIMSFMIRIVLPTISFILCYSLIIKALMAKKKVKPASAVDSNISTTALPVQSKYLLARNNLAVTLLYNLLIHVVFLSGNQILVLLYAVGYEYDTTGALSQLLVLATYINSCTNPFVYVIKYKKFREAIKQIID